MPYSRSLTLALVSCVVSAAAYAHQQVPLRIVAAEAASDPNILKRIARVRYLPNGSVLVDDDSTRRLLLFNQSLTRFTLVMDTAGGSANKYGGQRGGLVPYLGDSTLFIDGDARVSVLIDPAGKVARTIALPKLSDAIYLTIGELGAPGVDPKGRLIYRSSVRSQPRVPPPPFEPGKPRIRVYPDSAPILRADFDTRTVDTIGMIRVPLAKTVELSTQGSYSIRSMLNPLPSTDDWALLPDGTIALVRGYDYHVDWLRSDGTRSSSPKMQFDWKKITPDGKQRLLDSVKSDLVEREKKTPPPAQDFPGRPSGPLPPIMTVEASELPDYYPAIRLGYTRADLEGNLWILPTTSTLANSGLVWDVVNRKGEVFERVRLPLGRNLVGFGPSGVVFMSHVEPSGYTRLERARVAK